MRKGAPEGKPRAADGDKDKDKGISHVSDPAVYACMYSCSQTKSPSFPGAESLRLVLSPTLPTLMLHQ